MDRLIDQVLKCQALDHWGQPRLAIDAKIFVKQHDLVDFFFDGQPGYYGGRVVVSAFAKELGLAVEIAFGEFSTK